MASTTRLDESIHGLPVCPLEVNHMVTHPAISALAVRAIEASEVVARTNLHGPGRTAGEPSLKSP